ncbi:MAG: alpha/beta fold hydrolase [Phycisphaerales bacterium]|nr:alpha/beta fold hydrolase [Phycisphaerales bacterium]
MKQSPMLNPPAAAGNEVLRVDYTSGWDGRPDWGVVIPNQRAGDWAVVLHGHGSGGDQLLNRPDIRDVWLPALRSAGLGVLSPNARGNAWMSPATVDDLHGLIEWLKRNYSVRRLFLCGGSMGGTSALIYATRHPEQLSGVMALCPAADLPSYWHWARERSAQIPVLGEIASAIESSYGTTPDELPELYALHSAWTQRHRLTIRLALAHGTGDVIIPAEPTRQLAQSMSGRPDVWYEELPGGDHDSPLRFFPKALEWLLRNG